MVTQGRESCPNQYSTRGDKRPLHSRKPCDSEPVHSRGNGCRCDGFQVRRASSVPSFDTFRLLNRACAQARAATSSLDPSASPGPPLATPLATPRITCRRDPASPGTTVIAAVPERRERMSDAASATDRLRQTSVDRGTATRRKAGPKRHFAHPLTRFHPRVDSLLRPDATV